MGGVARDNRLFINAVFWILRTGAPWRDLPPDYGDWKNPHRRFCHWRDKRGLNSKLHLAFDAHDMPVHLLLTSGTAADCSQAMALITDLKAEHLLTDRGTTAMPLLNKPSSKACSHKFRREKTASNPATMT